MPDSIDVHIEELVLHGFAAGDVHSIGEAVERELTRRLTEAGSTSLMPGGFEYARIDGGEFDLEPGSNAEAIGVELGKAIYGGLGQWR